MTFNQCPLDDSLLDSQWKQKIVWDFIYAKSTKNTFNLNELLKWCKAHLRTSEMDEPLWQDEVEDFLWQLEGARLVKRIGSDFSGVPIHLC